MAKIQETAGVALLVEDDWLVLADLASEMERTGWSVVEASTGEGAIQQLRNGHHVSLLVTDIHLAGYLTGWDVAEAARELNPNLRVIYASANPVNPARKVEDSIFLSKPYAVSEVAKVANELRTSRPLRNP